MSYRQIGDEIGVSQHLVRWWLSGNKPKRVSRYEPDLTPSKDLAYVAGFYLGDGRSAGHEHKVRFNLADREQVEYVGGLVSKILRREPKPCKFDGLFYSVDYDSVALSDFLDQQVERLVAYLKGFERDLLRGFFDAEGYVSCGVNHGHGSIDYIMVGIANTRSNYLNAFGRLLADLGLAWLIRKTNRKGGKMTIRGKTWARKHDVFHLVIRGFPAVGEFSREVGFRIPAKAEKLADLLALQNRTPQEAYAWFTMHYRKEGHKWLKIRK